MDKGGYYTLAKIISGTYKYQIDSKGRVRIPSRFKELLGRDLLIGYGAGDYLVVYNQDMIQKITRILIKITRLELMVLL